MQARTAKAAWLAALTAALGGCGAAQARPVPRDAAVEVRPEVPCAEAPAPSSPGGAAVPAAPPPAEEPAKGPPAEEAPPPEPAPSTSSIGGEDGDEEPQSREGGTSPQSVRLR